MQEIADKRASRPAAHARSHAISSVPVLDRDLRSWTALDEPLLGQLGYGHVAANGKSRAWSSDREQVLPPSRSVSVGGVAEPPSPARSPACGLLAFP